MRCIRLTVLMMMATVMLLGMQAGDAFSWELAGNALQFDGTNDIAVVPERDGTLDITGEITVETWVKLFSRDFVPDQIAVSKQGAYTLYPEVHTYGGTGNWKGAPSFSPGITHVFGTTNLAINTWYHLAMTYNGTRIRVFLNGVQENEAEQTGAILHSDYHLNFGQNLADLQYALHGVLDEVRLWDVARTPQEIADNYNHLVDASTPGLAGYWNFNEEDGQEIYDLTVNENHGHLGRTNGVEVFDPLRIASDVPIVPRVTEIPGVFSTGVDDSGELLSVAEDDGHYTITAAPDPFEVPLAPKAASLHPNWSGNTDTSQWINPTGNGRDNLSPGPTFYEMTFDLTGLLADTAEIHGSWAMDNYGSIFLNGVDTGIAVSVGEHDHEFSFFTISDGFQAGLNTLEFRTYNLDQGDNPAGLQVNISSATAIPIPEPSTLVLLGMGAVGFLVYAWRRRNLIC